MQVNLREDVDRSSIDLAGVSPAIVDGESSGARDRARSIDGSDVRPEACTIALDIIGLSKSYGATHALRSVDLRLERGEVHALLGENGAGKSTLVKVLSGIVRPDAGSIAIAGVPFAPTSLMEARAAGLSTAFQELSLLPNLSVADNLMLPRLRKDRLGLAAAAANVRAAERVLAEFNAAEIDPKILVGDLSLAERQRIEIVRAFSHRPRILVLDEPTAALAQPEWLFHEVERVARAGTAVLYITHRLAEVRRLCSQATVLRNGSKIDTVRLTGTSDADVFRMMVGKAPGERAQRSMAAPDAEAPAALSVRDLSGAAVDGVSFDLRPGEILGVAALEGQGQRELFRMLAGAAPVRRGTMAVRGRTVAPRSPARALKMGIGFLPEDRKSEGIFRGIGTTENVSLSVIDQMTRLGLIDREEEQRRVGAQATEVELQNGYLGRPIDALSGGNQQKALLARVLLTGAKQLVLYDPTRGVDVGTKELIYGVIRRFVADGGSVLIYSTELEEPRQSH